jgi:ATP-dependent Clp protease adaptor protein ClpS
MSANPKGAPATPLLEPLAKPAPEHQTKVEPHWFVLLHDDDEHTYDYVIVMLVALCEMTIEEAILHAMEVDADGVTVVACKPHDEAEGLANQILRFGGDPYLRTAASMKATVEPANG